MLVGIRQGRNVLGVLLAVILACFAGLAVASPAHAAGSSVQIDNVHFDSSTIEDGTRQSLFVDWSIPERASNPVSLAVAFPTDMTGYPDTFTMKGPNGEDAGQCVVTATTITCDVDPTFITNNPQGVSGSFWFDVRTKLQNTQETEHTFDFGGVSVPVTVEPNSAVCTTTCTFPGYRFQKFGTYNSLDNTITWTVRVPAPPTGIPAGKNIVVTDQLDSAIFEQLTSYDGESYPQVWEGRCLKVNSTNQEVPRWVDRASGLTWNADQTQVQFASRAGTNSGASCTQVTAGSFYQVLWVVKVKDLGKAGTYQNSATYSIDGTDTGSTTGTATRHTGGGDVVGTDSGRFQVTKELNGNTVLDPAFTVTYQAYDATNTLIDSGSFDILNGQSFVSDEYPAGTRIVLSEVAPTAPSNVTWATPKFEYPAGTQTTELEFTFSAANGNLGPDNLAQILLVNDATLKTGTITVAKVVHNDTPVADSALPTSYRLNWSRAAADRDSGIPDIVGGGVTLAADGTPAVMNLAGAASYSFWESYVPAPAGTAWAEPVYTVNGAVVDVDPVTGLLNLGNLPVGADINLVVTNTLTQDVGGFTVTKSLSGDGSSLVPSGTEFTVSYSYTAVNGFPAGAGTVTVRAGETSPAITDIPAEAEVTLTEVRRADPAGGVWGAPVFSIGGVAGATFTAVKDQVIAVSLDNPVTRNADTGGGATAGDAGSGPLAATGVGFATTSLLPIALALLGSGLALLWVGRRACRR